MTTLKCVASWPTLLAGAAALLVSGAVATTPPAWWNQRQVLVPGAPSDNYAPANLGQAKHLATQALAELNAQLAAVGGAGFTLTPDPFPAPPPRPGEAGHNAAAWQAYVDSNYAPLNLGQLKNLAYRFYDRLKSVGYASPPVNASNPQGYPWTASTSDDDNYAPANLGQLKNVFSFDLSFDGDQPPNGLPDWWENRYFGHTGVVPNADGDGDGLTNLQEYQQGKDPTDYFNAQLTAISIKSGNNQSAGPNTWVTNPLVVSVNDGATNAAKVNAPIVFSSTTAMLATSPGGTGSSSVQARSNALGEAVVYLKLPGAGVVQEVTASGRSGVNTAQVVFYAEIAQLAPSPSSFSLFLNEGEVQERTITLVNSTDHKIKYSINPPVASSAQTQASPQDASNPEYNWTDSRAAADVPNRPAYVWHDISATGTLLSNFRDASSNPTINDGFQQVNLPFSFPFYGNAFTSCFVSTNGYVTFGTGSVQYAHYALPGTNMPPNLIAPLFKDLYITPPGKVYYRADSDKAVIQYDNIGAPRYTFQIVMEMSGNITFYYKTMNANSPNSPININDATVGIQNGDTITPHGRQVAFNRSYIGNGFAVRFYRPNLLPMVWARLQYDSGGVSAGDHASVGLTLDSTGLAEGVYTTTLHLKDDGGNAVGPDIPITLHVSGDATVDLDHDRLPDSWENGRFGNLNESANGDPDRDGLSNLLEYRLGSDPRNPDSNGDGVLDGLAYKAGISVTNPDMDGDGISNAIEIQRGANPFVRDSDGDGVPDGQDAYPSDPAGWQYSSGWLNDHTPPTITITSPTSGITLLN